MSWYSDHYQKRRTTHSRKILTPAEMKANRERRNAAIREWVVNKKLGTQPQTFKEVTRGNQSAQS